MTSDIDDPSVPPPMPAGAGVPHASFEDLLNGFRRRLDDELESWLRLGAGRRNAAAGTSGAGDLDETLLEFVRRGGKRLRPALVYYAYRGCGGRDEAVVLPLAMAIELLHTYLLIHDDIMDHAETRRGRPAAHVIYRRRHQEEGWRGDAAHYGVSAAILLGDLAYTYASELAATVLAGEAGGELRRIFATMCSEVIVGQYLELTVPFHANPREEELRHILQLKSGLYTAERPIELGALLAGAPAATRQALARYGLAVGEAFQLQDDLLGLFGRPEKTGKPVGADLREGKFTFLVYHALRAASPAERRDIRAALGDAELDAAEVERVCALIDASGARRVVLAMVEERLAAARRELAALALTDAGRAFFEGLIDFLRGRDE